MATGWSSGTLPPECESSDAPLGAPPRRFPCPSAQQRRRVCVEGRISRLSRELGSNGSHGAQHTGFDLPWTSSRGPRTRYHACNSLHGKRGSKSSQPCGVARSWTPGSAAVTEPLTLQLPHKQRLARGGAPDDQHWKLNVPRHRGRHDAGRARGNARSHGGRVSGLPSTVTVGRCTFSCPHFCPCPTILAWRAYCAP